MNQTLAHAAWPACTSALRLDRWLAGELPAAEAARLRAHLDGCPRCAAAAEALREDRDRAVLPPLRPARAPSRRPAWRLGALAGGLALAAGLLLLVRPGAPGERARGSGPGLAMWVRHGEEVRRAGPGEVVAAGDDLRFAVTSPEPAFVAVLSLDPAGRASVYFPAGDRAERVAGGVEVALPLATRLDATVGAERLLGLFCDRPVELEPLRAALQAGREAIPEGCRVTRWAFEKR
jgi:hypothetical protein